MSERAESPATPVPMSMHTLADGGGAETLRVLFAPYFPSNPYQRLLADGLSSRGVSVRGATALNVERPSLREAIDAASPDVVHLHWLHPYFARAGTVDSLRRARTLLNDVRRAKRDGLRVVWTAHNLTNHEDDHPRIDRGVTRRVAALADAVIAHGDAARDRVIDALGRSIRDKTHVIPMGNFIGEYPSGSDRAAARRRLDLDDDAFVVLFVGRIRPYKGVFELMEAFATARLPESSLLLIAGKTLGERPRLKLKKRCKRAERVRLDYGHIADELLPEYLRAADVTALPYHDVLTSSAVVLNMSFAAPVVAPRVGCITDALGDDGILYPPDDEHGLRDALVQAYERRAELAALGERGRANALEWPWTRVAAETDDVYRG